MNRLAPPVWFKKSSKPIDFKSKEVIFMVERRHTNQRQWVLDTLKAEGHLSALDIYNRVRADHPDISVATVYRNLGILTESGQVQIVGHSSQKEIYDARTDSHAHFVCRSCGQIFDLEGIGPSDAVKNLEASGHRVSEQRLTLYGLCRDCLEKHAKETHVQ